MSYKHKKEEAADEKEKEEDKRKRNEEKEKKKKQKTKNEEKEVPMYKKEEAADEKEKEEDKRTRNEENEKKEESKDKENEEKEVSKVQWIFQQIYELETDEVGCYREGNTDFAELMKSINNLRTTHSKVADMVEPISKLLETQNMKTTFTHLQGVYEFIIFVHKRYGVQLSENTSRSKDRALVDMMETAICK